MFDSHDNANAARQVLHQQPCSLFNGRVLFVEFWPEEYLKSFVHEPSPAMDIQSNIGGVHGLTLIENFVSASEEQSILNYIADGEWETIKNRRVVSFITLSSAFRFD